MLVTIIFKIFFVSQKWTRIPFKVWEIFLELYMFYEIEASHVIRRSEQEIWKQSSV